MGESCAAEKEGSKFSKVISSWGSRHDHKRTHIP